MTCKQCGRHPADQVLFTTFLRCGEGNATKRKSDLCDECCQIAMGVLDRIGMRIAFEGDGQLEWDAHVSLLENATAARARRAVQRDDVLMQMMDGSADKRGAEPSAPEKLSILYELADMKLIENTDDRRGEFWPEATCRLTEDGKQTAIAIQGRRQAETG